MDVDVPSVLLPCAICARTFMPQSLEKHTRICERAVAKKRKPFDSAKQRIQGTDLAEFLPKQEKKRHHEEKHSAISKSSWKQNHDDFLQAIRAARGETVDTSVHRKSASLVSTGAPTRANEKGICPTCNRHFGIKAYERHVAWCKDRLTRAPLSPATNLAKERLEARMKYRAPALKNRRAFNREKYSPSSTIALSAGTKASSAAAARTKESISVPNCNKGGDSPAKQKPLIKRAAHTKEPPGPKPMKSRVSDRINRPAEDNESGLTSTRLPRPSLRRAIYFPVPPLRPKKENAVEICKNDDSPISHGGRSRKERDKLYERETINRWCRNDDENGQNLYSARSQGVNIVSARSQGNPKVNDISVNDGNMGILVHPCTIYKEDELITWKQISKEKSTQTVRKVHRDLCDDFQLLDLGKFHRAPENNVLEDDGTQSGLMVTKEIEGESICETSIFERSTNEASVEDENTVWKSDAQNLNQTYLIKDSVEDDVGCTEMSDKKKWKPVRHSPRVEFFFKSSNGSDSNNLEIDFESSATVVSNIHVTSTATIELEDASLMSKEKLTLGNDSVLIETEISDEISDNQNKTDFKLSVNDEEKDQALDEHLTKIDGTRSSTPLEAEKLECSNNDFTVAKALEFDDSLRISKEFVKVPESPEETPQDLILEESPKISTVCAIEKQSEISIESYVSEKSTDDMPLEKRRRIETNIESTIETNTTMNKELGEVCEKYVNKDFEYDSDNTFGTPSGKDSRSNSELPSTFTNNPTKQNQIKTLSDSHLKLERRSISSASSNFKTPQLNITEMENEIRRNIDLFRGSTDTLISSVEAIDCTKTKQSNTNIFEKETVEEIDVSYPNERHKILPEIKVDPTEKSYYNRKPRITDETYWEKISKISKRRFVDVNSIGPKVYRFPKRVTKVRILPPVLSGSTLSRISGKDYDPFLLAEQQMIDLLSDASDQSVTDGSPLKNRDLFPLSHSSAFVKYPYPSNPEKRSSLTLPSNELDDLTSDFSSDSTEVNSLSREIFLKELTDDKEFKDIITPPEERKSPAKELGRRVIIDKSKALGAVVEDNLTRVARNFGSAEKARKMIDKTSPKVLRPTVNRSHSIRASSAPKTTPEGKTNTRITKKSASPKYDSQKYTNSRNNDYATLTGSNLSLSSIVSSEIDMKRSNSMFEDLMTSLDDDISFPSLRSFLKNDSLSLSSPVHGNRRNGQISDEEISSPESYKRQDHKKLSADSAYSSLNRKYSNHGRSTNDVAGRLDEDGQPRNSRRESETSGTAKCKMSKFCHECGSRFPETAKFCCECGVKRLIL